MVGSHENQNSSRTVDLKFDQTPHTAPYSHREISLRKIFIREKVSVSPDFFKERCFDDEI